MRLAGVDPELDLPTLRHRLERSQLEGDHLGLALLLVVDASLDDDDPVRHEELPRGRQDRVEDDDLRRGGEVVDAHEHHRLALLRRHLLDRTDDPADREHLTVAAALELG